MLPVVACLSALGEAWGFKLVVVQQHFACGELFFKLKVFDVLAVLRKALMRRVDSQALVGGVVA